MGNLWGMMNTCQLVWVIYGILFIMNVPYQCHRTQRIGQEGIAEIQNHKFFINDQWEWDTIREATPPVVPELASDDDYSNFDDISDPNSGEEFLQPPEAFAGNHLPFIGFSYSESAKWGNFHGKSGLDGMVRMIKRHFLSLPSIFVSFTIS
nr:rho-associated protein kinase 2-like [Pocillopora verrucosa]